MTMIRWLGVLLIGLAGFSNAATPAPGHRGPGQAPAPQPPDGQTAETRIAAVVNDEVISVADLQSRLRMVMLSSNFPDSQETRQSLEFYWSGKRKRGGQKQFCLLKAETDRKGRLVPGKTALTYTS